MPIKVCIIGAGSLGFTRGVVRDILCVPELRDTQFTFTDISERNLDMVYQLVRRDIEASDVGAKLSATTDRREAIRGANYVYSVVRVGGLEGFTSDIDIPLKYGVDQCVGDTICAGGIMYAQRTIPVLLEFCKDISEVGAPGCLFINHSNPMSMNMWACNKYGYGVKCVGLCHGVEGGHHQIARAFGLSPKEVDIICAGINHMTWFIQIKHKGEDLTGKLLEAFEKMPGMVEHEKVRMDILRRFGYYITESSGHDSEYLAWYRKRPEDILNWVDLSSWAGGETGGYLRICQEGRNWFEEEFPRSMREAPRSFRPEDRGGEHGSYIIESLQTGRVYRGHVNVANRGCITNLPPDAIVEAPGYVDGNGISIPIVGDLPLGCAAVCNAAVNMQRLAVEAAVSGDDMLLRQAMLMDPLTGAVCNPPEVWQMVDEMLVAQAEWLPQYTQAIADAKQRLASGTRVPTREGFRGAARIPVRTPEELRAQRKSG